MTSTDKALKAFMKGLKKRNPHEPEFHQAAEEVASSVMPIYLDNQRWREAQLLERVTEPDRIITFRVSWETDDGQIRANRAWRVQFSHALGPYKGGLRFDPSVTQSVLKFLGFEQIFKNSLTGLPMGGAKGGSNFNPKDKSEREVMRFCQSMMIELHRHIGEDIDVPAGDIGVGSREISFMFGQYMRLENRWTGVLTGKGESYGGSAGRTEATGYGCVFFLDELLQHHGEGLADKRVAISGSGNVARYAAEKALAKCAKVISLSDSSGTVYVPDGLTEEMLSFAHVLKEVRRGRIGELADEFDGVEYQENKDPWELECDIAMPCATQNELDGHEAETLIKNGVRVVCEGANMPTTKTATEHFAEAGVLHAPGKAANAGGVSVSGLEMTQNSMRMSWSREKVEEELCNIMRSIHKRCVDHAPDGDTVNYVDGANIAGFEKVAKAMLAYGVY